MNINIFISNLIDSISEPFLLVRLNIECPLASGFKVVTKLETSKEIKTINIPGRLRPLYEFIKEEKASHNETFNRAELMLHPNGAWQVSYSYDEKLQKLAEESVK